MEVVPKQWDSLQWLDCYGQFESAIDSQSLTDDVKLKYLNTLVNGEAKTAIAEFAYCGAMYKDELRTLESKIGQPQAVVSAHLDKPSSCLPAITSLTNQGAFLVLLGSLNRSHAIRI